MILATKILHSIEFPDIVIMVGYHLIIAPPEKISVSEGNKRRNTDPLVVPRWTFERRFVKIELIAKRP